MHNYQVLKMVNPRRHNRVVKILYELCESFGGYSDVYADHVHQSYRPIDIVTPHAKGQEATTYPYHPDVWAKLEKNNLVDIYEVWDGQSDSDSVEDVALSALVGNVSTLSIICFNEEVASFANRLVRLILPSVHDAKGESLLDKDSVLPYIVTIPSDMQSSDQKIQQFLSEKLNLADETFHKGQKVWYWPRGDKFEYAAKILDSVPVNQAQISITDNEWPKKNGRRLKVVLTSSLRARR